MKVIGVETKDGIYVTNFVGERYNRYSSLGGYLVDGVQPKESHLINWTVIKSIPKKIQRYVAQPDINRRWELKDSSLESDKIPSTLTEKELYYDWESECYTGEYSNYHSLYEKKSDKQKPTLENVEFEYEKVLSIENINGVENRFKEYGKINHQLVDKMIYPDVALVEKPCSFTPEVTYKIIRGYIKNHINPLFAEITSDYDFCFTVKKKIKLEKIESWTVDVNNSIFQKRKRKPKIETRYRKERLTTVFEMAPKAYQSYTVINGFTGKNHTELQKKVDVYCERLIKMINEPLVDCPNCLGKGVINAEDKITKAGQPCRKCLTSVEKRVPHKKGTGKYYFKYYFQCPNKYCNTMYMVESAKVYK